MVNSLTSAILLGAVTVSAVPTAWGPPNGYSPPSFHHPSSTVSSTSAGQTAFTFPLTELPSGFPTVDNSTLRGIEQRAHGTLPNGALPTTLSDTSVTVLQLIAFNEIFEVAFFTNLIQNVTNNVQGYRIDSPVLKNLVLNTLHAVQAQEELHFLGANGILASANKAQIEPCSYVFPV